MFTKREHNLSLDIFEILAIVNLNLAQNYTVKCICITGYFTRSLNFPYFSHNKVL